MGLTACTEAQCLYKGAFYPYLTYSQIQYGVAITAHITTKLISNINVRLRH